MYKQWRFSEIFNHCLPASGEDSAFYDADDADQRDEAEIIAAIDGHDKWERDAAYVSGVRDATACYVKSTARTRFRRTL